MKRIISLFLCFVVLWTGLSVGAVPLSASAAENGYQFVLDTDGIDAGTEYIIASASSGAAMALKMDATRPWEASSQSITIKSGQGANSIDAFENDSYVTWTFSGSSKGTVSTHNYYLNISQYTRYETNPATLNFTNLGEGRYGIHLEGGSNTNLQFLGVNSENQWATLYSYGVNGSNISHYNGSHVYLFKKVTLENPEYTIGYDANGATVGSVPSDIEELETGKTHTVKSPSADLKKVEDGDTYLFKCWNTAADGSGIDYMPGDTLTVEYHNVTLYAKWYTQIKYSVTITTNLDGTPTDINKINGNVSAICISEDGTTFFELSETTDGIYTYDVHKNGTYHVYFKDTEGNYEQVAGHQVIIYNQSGSTTLQNYSVTYNTGDDASTPAWTECFHANSVVFATDKIPVRNGYTFKGWTDSEGNIYNAGDLLTEAIKDPAELTAIWEETNTITVQISINHEGTSGGADNDSNKDLINFQLLTVENGVNMPVENGNITLDDTYPGYKLQDNCSTYTYSFTDMPQAEYNVATVKSGYELTLTKSDDGKSIYIEYIYAPNNFDFHFNVRVDENTHKDLHPVAVNVKVTYWGYNASNELGWHTITQQDGDGFPVTVNLTDGEGAGFFPVWKTWSTEGDHAYEYRVEITSFILPDGSIVAASTDDNITYKADGSSVFKASVGIEGEGRVPAYPSESNTDLYGGYFENEMQHGVPLITISAEGFDVVFDATEGTINGKKNVTLTNQYRYPNLYNYSPVPDEEGKTFFGWQENSLNAENKAGQLLNEDIIYTAKWSNPLSVSGTITINGSYRLGDETASVPADSRAESVMVVLKKFTDGVYNDFAQSIVTFGNYDESDLATGTYEFTIPDDGASYSIYILVLNYSCGYDNNKDGIFAPDEFDIILGDAHGATVDAYLELSPESYYQMSVVDTSRINEKYRPTDILAQITYRDLGSQDDTEFRIISQHLVPPYGSMISIGSDGQGQEGYDVWKWHTNGTRYEYRMSIEKLYGTIEGVYSQDGTEYDNNSSLPYTIRYKSTAWWDAASDTASGALTAVIEPKTYKITFDMGLDEEETVLGMENYVTDDNKGGHYYSYSHTWSFDDRIIAFPYRPGYVFKGWTSNNVGVFINNDGYITIAAALAEDVTLTAEWEKLDGICYTVRYLELNTNNVLHGAKVVSGVTEGQTIHPHNEHIEILGYKYEGVSINGEYYSNNEAPDLTVNRDNNKNMITIYYIPDGSDGYTEQVESNLSLNKTATLENNGTYTITMETYTKDNPITTQIMQNTPLDIVLVLDQSGSIINSGYLDELESAVENFISLIADHGRENKVDHRIAMVGYAGNATEAPTSTNTSTHPIAGGNTSEWVNTGVFDSNGDFHPYPVTGFNYTSTNENPTANGTYYVKSGDEYLLLMHHDTYYHLIDENTARIEHLYGTQVYGNVKGTFVPLSRNLSGLWLYGEEKLLYSSDEFFTYHEDVWTHREGMNERQIHAYGTGNNYTCTDGHSGLYIRTETKNNGPHLNVYKDALVPVSVGDNGSGSINPGLIKASNGLGSNGGTYVQYGIEMANKVFAANPLDPAEGRVRIMIMFTDGLPGIGTFDSNVANEAINQAYTSKNTHNAYSYTIGLYPSNGVSSTSDVSIYMNAVSSNYPTAKQMTDVYKTASYYDAAQGTNINDGKKYYVKVTTSSWWNSTTNYYELNYGTFTSSNRTYTGWYYNDGSKNTLVTTELNATVGRSSKIGNYTISGNSGGYQATTNSGYYSTTDSVEELVDYFSYVMKEITTKITTEIILHEDTILRDIVGTGLELSSKTVITAYRQPGTYNAITQDIDWKLNADGTPALEKVASLDLSEGRTESQEKVLLDNTPDGIEKTVSYIQVFNYDATNTTDPDSSDYHPHTVDITGYDFENWFISDMHPEGYKLYVEITCIEARDSVNWGRSSLTNNEVSGLWLPADANGNRELLLPFDQPSTIFVERTYVVDYAKPFELSGWFFDKIEGNEKIGAVHIDTEISDGMNWFDENNPSTSSLLNAEYGNITINDGVVTYTPTSLNWGKPEQFYIFGDTENETVLTQDANTNGNLWTKVTIIPANNIYYEDTFETTPDTDVNGYDGFTYSGTWTPVYSGYQNDADKNTETPEHLESPEFGDVHGWIDSVGDDNGYSDSSAHGTGLDGKYGASVEFTFTGTGVDVYTRTNSETGLVVAMIKKIVRTTDDNGNVISKEQPVPGVQNIIMDNLSVSGDYYHIPTISFSSLEYGTYKVKLLASASSDVATGYKRFEYYLDGVRVYNPLNTDQTEASEQVKEGYGKELNARFIEIRDILLDYGDFNTDTDDSNDGKAGAVFIDSIKDGQTSGDDIVADGTHTYEIGTFESYGPKNEIYLSPSQSIVLKVDSVNNYYVGMKSIDGSTVKANVCGISKAEPTTIVLNHSTDMYYEITPIDGYIVIENASDNNSVLSLTKLRVTNVYNTVDEDCGILPAVAEEAVMFMSAFALRMRPAEPEIPEEDTDIPEKEPSTDNSDGQENNGTDNEDVNSLSFIEKLIGFFRKIIEFITNIFSTLSGGEY
ncbi:MAG: InlB B-repeat-containing protein [Clostridia bacterium]|nr:InlB B-repeat-containing protein [Clostridia bacterium]